METRRDVIVRTAVLADELGYEIFALPEGWGLDSAPVLTEIALRTGRINLASSILSVWSRTPATLAMTAATLHQISGGRYVLGLGASTKALVEGFHDTAFEHPAAKLRDVVTKVRTLLAGQPAQLSHANAARPLRMGQPPAPDIPGPSDHRREPAPQPQARDRPPRRPGRARPARRLRNRRSGPRAARALAPRGRHRHHHAAARPAVAQHRSDSSGSSAGHPAGGTPS
jgi:alkanesulfonate monooxygenase SsuD/methylene tetrahydromethanopterin reductase-like flavin-dependent oxidoreductase (luciferase family)